MTINMPGFTAELSLYANSRARYVNISSGAIARAGDVVRPQINWPSVPVFRWLEVDCAWCTGPNGFSCDVYSRTFGRLQRDFLGSVEIPSTSCRPCSG